MAAFAKKPTLDQKPNNFLDQCKTERFERFWGIRPLNSPRWLSCRGSLCVFVLTTSFPEQRLPRFTSKAFGDAAAAFFFFLAVLYRVLSKDWANKFRCWFSVGGGEIFSWVWVPPRRRPVVVVVVSKRVGVWPSFFEQLVGVCGGGVGGVPTLVGPPIPMPTSPQC